jgi:hypothetical protein
MLFCRDMQYRTSVTFGVAGIILAVCLSGLGLNQQGSKRARVNRKTNTQPIVIARASPSLVKLPPRSPDLHPDNCEPTESMVKLSADATDPNKGGLYFTWQVPVGRLIGEGREVTWDLGGVQEGTYTATVEVSDKHNTATGSATVTVVVCPGLRPSTPCPTVSVSCPAFVESKESITFVATVAGGDREIKPTYKWSLSAGKIISGQATSKITIDVSGISGESVTATVSVGGFHPLCHTVASCTILKVEHE